jgi:acyl carrier protein
MRRRSAAAHVPVNDLFVEGKVPVVSAVFDRLQAIVAEQLGVETEKITPDAEFIQDLNADSLDMVELVMSLEEEFGVEISDEEVEKIIKVSDAVEYIEENANA